MRIIFSVFLLFINIITCIGDSKNLRLSDIYRPRSISAVEGDAIMDFAQEGQIINTNIIVIGDANVMDEGIGDSRISLPIDLLNNIRALQLGEELDDAENALDTILASLFRQQRLIERYAPHAVNLAGCILVFSILLIALRV